MRRLPKNKIEETKLDDNNTHGKYLSNHLWSNTNNENIKPSVILRRRNNSAVKKLLKYQLILPFNGTTHPIFIKQPVVEHRESRRDRKWSNLT